MIFVGKIKCITFEGLLYYLELDMNIQAAYEYALSLWDTPEAESLTEHIYLYPEPAIESPFDEEETQ